MDMPKQMGSDNATELRQPQQGESFDPRQKRAPQRELAETPAEQMRATHFSDWASI
ncbi:MAG: hypothetical protein H6897_01525 [Rhodobacteraceae bacterium]|jgi:hypothetical protein|uniref:hypothetical protein n=1 Tax=Albidovulum sp. TaxID=1872424 RepID=UPI001D95392C|nr:hypothetical protein [uncultured Defluviimonas sp.]MCB2125623.1 hypothetical protein [Paracoccaceae bacterium]MCC0068594.1 hypothetical protein [Paracoccaceae bacterium]